MGHEEEGDEGLDLETGLWASVRGAAVDARWLAEVGVVAAVGCEFEPDEVQAVCNM